MRLGSTALKLFVLIALSTATTTAKAQLIEGAILFSRFDWNKNGTTVSVTGPSIISSVGDLTGQTGVVISDTDYSPFVPFDPLWETDDFRFFLTSLSILDQTASELELEGVGILSEKIAFWTILWPIGVSPAAP